MKIKIWRPAVIFIIIFFIGKTYKMVYDSDIRKEGVKDTAVVNRIYSGRRGSLYFDYQYKVDGVVYNGYDSRSKVEYQDVQLGDSIVIEYKSSEPEKSIPHNIIKRNTNYTVPEFVKERENKYLLHKKINRALKKGNINNVE